MDIILFFALSFLPRFQPYPTAIVRSFLSLSLSCSTLHVACEHPVRPRPSNQPLLDNIQLCRRSRPYRRLHSYNSPRSLPLTQLIDKLGECYSELPEVQSVHEQNPCHPNRAGVRPLACLLHTYTPRSQGDGLISSKMDAATVHPSHPYPPSLECILFLLRPPASTSVCFYLYLPLPPSSPSLLPLQCLDSTVLLLRSLRCINCSPSFSLFPPSAYLPLAKGSHCTWLV